MAFTLSQFLAYTDGLFDADNDIISQLRRYRLVKAAVERYSDDAPDEETDDVTGDAGKYYGIATNLSEWIENFSYIKSIEYPASAISADATPIYLDPADWREDYWIEESGVQVRYLFLPNHAPAATETMRISYSVPYSWTASSTTTAVTQSTHGFSKDDYVYLDGATWYSGPEAICTHQVSAVADTDNFTAAMLQTNVPRGDFFAVCDLAACLICRAMSARFSKSGESTIRADSVRHVTKAQEYAARAKEFCAAYQMHLGIGEFAQESYQAASEFVDWDTEPEWPAGRRFLTHHGGLR
jgi:hypothetical protein